MSRGGTDCPLSTQIKRKLTTILAADAEGYSREMNADEVRAFDALHDARDVFARFIERHDGRVANTAGDGLIAEFPSVVEAVKCAVEVQQELRHHAGGLHFRIGIHLGDVMVDGDDLLGEGVNLAARLQAMAEPGGILISQQVYDQVHSKLAVSFEYLGERRPKNFPENVPVYGVSGDKKGGHRASNQRRTHSVSVPQHSRDEPKPSTDPLVRLAKQFGVLWLAVLALDVFTGPPFWAHWPGLAILLILAWQAAPIFATARFDARTMRLAAILVLIFLVNIVTWSGVLWAVWPAGALILFEVLRRLRVRAD